MLTATYENKNDYWDINKILNQEDDVELEDEELNEEEETKSREKTPDLNEDVFRDNEDIAIAECF